MKSKLMQTSRNPRLGTGRFQWNTGAWFGSIAGGTAWMIVMAGFLVANRQLLVAAVPAGCFVITNMIAFALWTRRELNNPFSGLMAILAVLAFTVPLSYIAVSVWGSQESLAQMNWPSSAIWHVVVLLLVPAMMAWLYVLERHSQNALGDADDAT
ncbi:hypothetical protein [Aporhodopirellula aestuarii]|uniref:Uncharacterized protein n=1 Tax=Aporhodopirellula aestuarii TaxID=2950107 RepID=A0ABT0UA77_9BACT|nr:hypothetical protein [Aporhodopirellula aestuarii]MCM2373903.1 hypothetical protein [Aporhodopirellula aestuarii]